MHNRKIPYHLFLLFILLVGILYLSGSRIRTETIHDPRPRILALFTEAPEGFVKVVDIVDGDTIVVEINGKEEMVRFLGVDTPETKDPRKSVQCFGRAASAYTKLKLSGKAVRLMSDPLEQDRDKYGRLLRYIYLSDGTNLNEMLVAHGFAFAYERFPTTRMEQLKLWEKDARDHHRGLWGTCTVTIKNGGKQKSTQNVSE